MAVDLVHVVEAPTEEEVVVVEMNGTVVQQEGTCLAEEVIPPLEVEDLNIPLPVMILVQNTILVS